MFRDARTLDVQHTAASFDKAHQRYTAHAEDWFDGTVGSIDTRLAACNQLLHRVGATVARMNLTDAHRYLTAAEDLSADQSALQDLRYAMLTGGAGREVVESDEEYRAKRRDQTYTDPAGRDHYIGSPEWGRQVKDVRKNREACSDFDSDHHPKVPSTKVKDKKQKLSGTDRRWVTLEAARFVAANTSTCDDPHELATRAQHHAAVKTSTFTPARSQDICAAFVDEVVGLQERAPQVRVASVAQSFPDFPAEAMYLT